MNITAITTITVITITTTTAAVNIKIILLHKNKTPDFIIGSFCLQYKVFIKLLHPVQNL